MADSAYQTIFNTNGRASRTAISAEAIFAATSATRSDLYLYSVIKRPPASVLSHRFDVLRLSQARYTAIRALAQEDKT